MSRFQWNESLQFKRLLTIQGTVLVQCMLSCFGRKIAASAAFGASFSNLVAKKANAKYKRLVTKLKGPQKGERRELKCPPSFGQPLFFFFCPPGFRAM